MSKKIRILLADDHAVVRQGFRMILGAQADMEIIGEAGNGREAVSMSEQLHPDVVVMDVAMPELNETPRQIQSEIKISSYQNLRRSRSADIPLSDIAAYLRLHPTLSHADASWLFTKY